MSQSMPLPEASCGRGKFLWSTSAQMKPPAAASIAALCAPSSRVLVGPPLSSRLPRSALALLLLLLWVRKPHDVPLSRLFLSFINVPLQFAPMPLELGVPSMPLGLGSETIVLRRKILGLPIVLFRLMLLPLGAELWLTVTWLSVPPAPAVRVPPPVPVALLSVIVTLVRRSVPNVECSPPPSRDAVLSFINTRSRM